jgi:hypothetical protein
MSSLRQKIIQFLQSLKVNNETLLKEDIQWYSYMADSYVYFSMARFGTEIEMLDYFSKRYGYCFNEDEIIKLSKFVKAGKMMANHQIKR